MKGGEKESVPERHSMPNAFILIFSEIRKALWVKRGNFLIVNSISQQTNKLENTKGVCHRIEHVLSKDHVKQLKQKGMFPIEFMKDNTAIPGYSQRQADGSGLQIPCMHDELGSDFVNPNRRVPVEYCSEEEEGDASDDDGGSEVSLDEENEE